MRTFNPKNSSEELWQRNKVSSKSSVFTTLTSTVSTHWLFEYVTRSIPKLVDGSYKPVFWLTTLIPFQIPPNGVAVKLNEGWDGHTVKLSPASISCTLTLIKSEQPCIEYWKSWLPEEITEDNIVPSKVIGPPKIEILSMAISDDQVCPVKTLNLSFNSEEIKFVKSMECSYHWSPKFPITLKTSICQVTPLSSEISTDKIALSLPLPYLW